MAQNRGKVISSHATRPLAEKMVQQLSATLNKTGYDENHALKIRRVRGAYWVELQRTV